MPLRPLLLQQEWTEIPRDRLERTFHTNIIAMFSLAQKAVKHMPKGGSIINISSVQAYGELCSGMPGVVGHFCKSCSKVVNAVWPHLCTRMPESSGWTSLQGHWCRASVDCQVTPNWPSGHFLCSHFVSTQSHAAAWLVCCPSMPCHPLQGDCREVGAAALLSARSDSLSGHGACCLFDMNTFLLAGPKPTILDYAVTKVSYSHDG